MPILGSFASGAIGTVGLAQQAMLAFLKASTAISGSSFVLQQLIGGPDGSYIAGRNNSINGQSSFAADGDYLVTGSGWTNEVLVWNLSDGSLHMTIPAPSPPPQTNGYGWQIDIHGDYFITGNGGTGGGYTTIHNVSTGALITSFTGAARNVAIDENYAAACANGGPIKIFELATSTLTTFPDPNGGLADLMDISGNNLILAPNNGSLITVHDIPTALSNGNLNTTSLTINTTVSYFQTLIAGGNYLALGRTGAGDQSILIYDLTTGTLLHTLPAPVGASAAFGNAIDIKGNYLVAGHRGQEQYSPAAVYDLTTGILLQTFTGDDIPDTSTWQNTDVDKLLGTAVAITDSKTIIGSSSGGESANNWLGAFLIYSNPGQAAISEEVSLDWSNITLEHTLDNPNPFGTSENDQFGMDIAMSSTHAIIGTYAEDDAGGTNSGKAYIFDLTTGLLLHTLDNPNPVGTSTDDWFAYSVAISDTYAIVGAFREEHNSVTGGNAGKAYIYKLSDGSLIKTLINRDTNGNPIGDLFGHGVAISDTHAIVSAWGEDWGSTGTVSGVGSVYIYDISPEGIVTGPRASMIISNPSDYPNGYFGWGVEMNDNYVIVTSPNDEVGKAYIFNVSDGSLVYTLDNPGGFDAASRNDNFGATRNFWHSTSQAAISDNYAIVSAPYENDADGLFASGIVYVFDMSDGSLAHTLYNPNPFGTTQEDYFGMSVDLDGDFVIVGAPYEDDAGTNYAGKAYIFDLTDGSLVNTIDDPNAFGTTDNDRFGHAVAMSDGRALISASREDDGSGTSANSSGKAYIFSAQTTVASAPAAGPADWSNATLAYTLDNPNPYGTSQDDYFANVAISSTYAIIGAQNEMLNESETYGGIAYIVDPSDGSLVYTLHNPNQGTGSEIGDMFGISTAISDTHAIVGAYSEDDSNGLNSGIAYIFDLSDGSLAHTINNPNAYGTATSNGYSNDGFGYAVAISDTHAIVGVPSEDDANGAGSAFSGNDSGKAYIFNVSDGSLLHTLDNPDAYGDGVYDWFGGSVAISDTHVIVGARGEDDTGGDGSGKAYIFNVTSGSLVYTLDNPNAYSTSAGDQFGQSVAISDTHAIVGAYNEDDAGGTTSGKAYIFDLSDGSLAYTLHNPNQHGTSQNDHFGWTVSISDTHAIVSAMLEEDADGNSSGKVYIYDLSDGSLTNTLDNPNAYGTSEGDRFGSTVAISGSNIIVGAVFEDDAGGTSSGKAYIFNASEAAPVSSGWSVDLSNITYDNVSYTIADNLDNTPYQIVFNDDGTKMYVMGGNNDRVLTYPLSTSFDLSTISALSGLFTVSSQETGPTSLAFNTDGTKMYILGYGSANIHQYTLSTPFQVNASSVSYDNVSFSVSNQELYPMNLVFNTDGTKMYVNGFDNTIYEYALTTAFDVSSASFNNASFSGATEATGLYGFRFNQDGTKMYWISNQSDAVYQYSLATAFDVSTTSYDNVSYSILSEDRETLDLVFSNDGTKMYISGSHSDTVYQYSTGL